MKRAANHRMSRPVAMVFFSLFLIAGLIGLWFLLIRPVLRVWDARHWPATPCKILSSQVRSHSDSDGTTYSVHIVFRYTVGGREYQSDRYEFTRVSSSGYRSKRAIVDRYPPGSEAICYVNPRDPADAVLERRATPLLLVGLMPLFFVGFGAAGLLWAVTTSSLAKPIQSDVPWESRADWAEGRMVSSNKAIMLAAWVAGVIFNIAVWPLALMLMEEFPWAILLLFIGAGLLLIAFRLTRRWQQFGETIFEMTTRPGAVGGALAGTLRLRQFVRFDNGLRLCLRCIRLESSGKNTVEKTLWADEQNVPVEGADVVPVNFYIPPDCPETDAAKSIFWRLEARGTNYSAQFEVPVFRVAQDPSIAQKALVAKQAALTAYRRPVDSPIRVESSWRGGTDFYFPAARNLGAVIGTAVFMAAWTGAVVAMFLFKAPPFLIIIFSAVELIVLAILCNLWFASSRVNVTRETVTITRAMLGWRRERVVPVADINRFTVAIGMTAGTTPYYDIQILRRDGKTELAGRWIPSKLEADWLAAEMARCAGITPASTL